MSFGRVRPRFGEDGSNKRRRRRSMKGSLSGGHLEEEGTERENVGPHVDGPSLELFRSHVGRSSNQRALYSRGRSPVASISAGVGPFRRRSRCFAIPKSSSLGPLRVNITLDGLRSR